MFRPVVLVPFYNHGPALEGVALRLKQKKLPVLIVDDGSAASHAQMAQKVCQKHCFNYIRNERNGGKGAAVLAGLRWAFEQKYTHAVQVDADGQHDLRDIETFLDLAQKNPAAIVSAQPVYDKSVPKSRLYGRKITRFWVWIETAGKLKWDTMCGFRVYPLAQMAKVCPSVWFRRMGFDVEILVKSFLVGVPIMGQPTRIIYPKDGVSHFRAFRDNLEISCVHASLCLYSVWKLLTRGRKK